MPVQVLLGQLVDRLMFVLLSDWLQLFDLLQFVMLVYFLQFEQRYLIDYLILFIV